MNQPSSITQDTLDKAGGFFESLKVLTSSPDEAIKIILLLHARLFVEFGDHGPEGLDTNIEAYSDDLRRLVANALAQPKPAVLGPDGKPVQ